LADLGDAGLRPRSDRPGPEVRDQRVDADPGAVTRSAPAVRATNPSPPFARKSFIATRYVRAGSIGWPPSVIAVIRWPSGLVVS
jgi:hypothetical protein